MPDTRSFSIAALNAASPETAIPLLGLIFERSPWLAARLAAQRPFSGVQDLGATLAGMIRALGPDDALRLLDAHPELAPPTPERMTEASQGEQARLGLICPAPGIAERLARLNARYRARFGFPFILALHAQPDLDTVLAQFEGRLGNLPGVARMQALDEVVSVALARLARLTDGAGEVAP